MRKYGIFETDGPMLESFDTLDEAIVEYRKLVIRGVHNIALCDMLVNTLYRTESY